LQHLRTVEVATGGDDEVGGMKPVAVKLHEIVARDGVDAGHRRELVDPKLFSVSEDAALTELDTGGVVVALRHALEELLFAQVDLVLLELRLGERLAQDREALVEVLREQV